MPDDPKLSAADKRDLETARANYADALREYLDLARRLAPYKVGDHIRENDFEDDPPMTVVEAISADISGVVQFTGKLLTKGGKLGKRSTSRRVNLHHLEVEGG